MAPAHGEIVEDKARAHGLQIRASGGANITDIECQDMTLLKNYTLVQKF